MSILEQAITAICGVIIMVIPLNTDLAWPMIGGAVIVMAGIIIIQKKQMPQVSKQES